MLYAFIRVGKSGNSGQLWYKLIAGIHMIEKQFDFWRDHSLNYLQMAFDYVLEKDDKKAA